MKLSCDHFQAIRLKNFSQINHNPEKSKKLFERMDWIQPSGRQAGTIKRGRRAAGLFKINLQIINKDNLGSRVIHINLDEFSLFDAFGDWKNVMKILPCFCVVHLFR